MRRLLAGPLSITYLNNTYPALHGLRFFTAIYVIAWHCKPYPSWFPTVWFGMDIFFILSGYLIGLILFYHLDSDQGSLKRFYIRRAFRTFALFYFVLLVATITYIIKGIDIGPVWREYLYLGNYYRLFKEPYVMFWGWSLAVEEHFYLFCPTFLVLLGKLKTHQHRFAVMFAVILLTFAYRLYFYLSGPIVEERLTEVYYFTHYRIDEFVWGIVAAYCSYHFKGRTEEILNHKYSRIFVPMTVVGLMAWHISIPPVSLWSSLWFCIAGVAFSLLILYLIHVRSWLEAFFSHKIFLVLATLTYGSYLVHIYVIRFVKRTLFKEFNYDLSPDNQWLAVFIVAIVLTFALSYILHILIEKPFLYLRQKHFP